MGFGLKRTFRKTGGLLGLAPKLQSGSGPNFGFQDPNPIANEERERIEGFQFSGLPDRRKALNDFQFRDTGLRGLLDRDMAYGGNVDFGGPAIEDDQATYDAALASAREQATFDEQRGTENVLGGLQGRGLVRSGIALKDVVSQVLGPSIMRQNQLASQFGLEKARRRSDLLEGQREAQRRARLLQIQNRASALGDEFAGIRSQDTLRFGGLQDILGDESAAIQDRDRLRFGGLADIGTARLGAAQREREMSLADQINQRRGMEERRRRRKGGLAGLFGGAVGGFFGGPGGAYVGSQMGQQAGDLF